MKLFDFGIIAIIVTVVISAVTGAQINEDFGIAPVKKEQTEGK